MQGVRAFAQRCRYERPHSEQVAMLSLSIYDQLCEGSSLLPGLGAEARERELLDPLIQAADLVVDTTHMGVHELRDVIVQRIDQRRGTELSVTLVSFGFKHGVPGDCDFVFDARTLPNPYWTVALRALTGRDPEVIEYLGAQPAVAALIEDLARFIGKRIEEHQAARRRYLTIGIGCTGGQHRSVYVVDRIADRLRSQLPALAVRHSALATRMSG
jgi:UPF0042 nucleotide-binding protein